MSTRLRALVEGRVGPVHLLALWLLMTPCLWAQQYRLEQAGRMLQELDQERMEAAKAGTGAKFNFVYINRRLTEIETSLNSGLALTLRSPDRPSCDALQDQLRHSLGYRGEPDPNVASVLCLPNARVAYYVVAYALTCGATFSRSWIGLFGPPPDGTSFGLLASAENTLPNKTVALVGLRPGVGGRLTFLAYGINWGDAHNRLTLIAYCYTGKRLNPVWSRADLPEGQLKVDGAKIELTYLSSPLGPGQSSVRSVTQTYRLTPAGIELARPSRRRP